ncbi:MAG: hypothetical protein QOE60_143 [Thermoleophilaceae bacterium]|jgi:uncharacterized protein (TIGR00369 family)|nr:hypothetical protein [Thermoleophilaceae bacterium]
MADRTLTVSWQDPAELAAAARAATGLEFLRAIISGELAKAPIQELVGFELEEADEGRVVFSIEPGEQHYNPIGSVHGGVAATLLDSAMGAAVHSTLPQGSGYATLEVKFNLVRAITAETGRVLAEGKVIHRGKSVATVEATLRSADGDKLLAHGTSTCLIR